MISIRAMTNTPCCACCRPVSGFPCKKPGHRPNAPKKRNGAENSPVFLLHMRLKIYVDVMPSKFADTLRYPSYKSTHEHGECCTGLRCFFAIHPKGPVNHLLRVAKCPFPHHFPGRFFPVHEDAGPVDLPRKPGVTHKPEHQQ